MGMPHFLLNKQKAGFALTRCYAASVCGSISLVATCSVA